MQAGLQLHSSTWVYVCRMAVPSGHCMVTTSSWALASWQQVQRRCMAWASMEYLQTRGTLSTRPGPPQLPSWLLWGLQTAAAHGPRAARCLLPEPWGFTVPAWAGSGGIQGHLER